MEYNEIFTGTVKEFHSKFKEIPEGYDGTEDPGYLNYIFEDSEEAELLRNEFSSLAGGEPIEPIKPDPDELKNSESEILSMGRDMISTMSGEISRKLDSLEGKYLRSGFSLTDLENFIKDSRDSIGKLVYDELGGIKDSKNKLDSIETGLVVNEKVLEEEGAKPPPPPVTPPPVTPPPVTPPPVTPPPPPVTPPPVTPPPPPSPKTVPIRILGENEFKVMTYNVEFNDINADRFNAIAEVINFESPDILAIQEGGWIYGFDRIVLDGYQNGGDVIASRNPNSKTILYYNKDKFEKIGEKVKSDPRGISGLKLKHKNTGKIFCAVSFHLDHYQGLKFPSGSNDKEKTRTVFQQILKDLQYRPGDHVILMGDSNEFYEDILGQDRVKDMDSSPDPFKITTGGYQVDINFKDGEDKSCCVPVVAQRTNPRTGVYAHRADIIGSDLESFDVELSKKELEMSKSNVLSDHRPVIGYFKVKDDKPGEYEFFEYKGGKSDRENKSRFGFRKTGESQLYECRVDVSDQSLKDFFTTLMNMKGVTVAIVTFNYRFAIQGFLDYLFSNNSSVADQIEISVPEDVGDRGDVIDSRNKNLQLKELKKINGISTNSQIVLVDDSEDNIVRASEEGFLGIKVNSDENFSNRGESEIFDTIYKNGDKKFIAGFDFDDTLVHGHAYNAIATKLLGLKERREEFGRRFSATDKGSDPLPTRDGERMRIADGERDKKEYKYIPKPKGYENYTQVKSVKNLSDMLLRLNVDSRREDKLREKMREALAQRTQGASLKSPLKLKRENKKLNEIRKQKSDRMKKIKKLKTVHQNN